MIISRFPHRKAVAVKKRLDYNDWPTIAKVSADGQAKNYWAVGDAKEVIVNGAVGNTTFSSVSVWAFIIGFDHNSSIEGTGKIHFQIGKTARTGGKDICLIDSKYNSTTTSSGYFNMNESGSNAGGWESSKMRTVLLGSSYSPSTPFSGSLMAALPADLRGVMKGVTKYSDNTGGGKNTASYVTATTDYLWLLSEHEVFGTRSAANSAEQSYQKQYAYYANGNSKVKYRHSAIASSAIWWLRSAASAFAHAFCYVNSSGAASGDTAVYSYGLAPAFAV